jgi:hypothetical protein
LKNKSQKRLRASSWGIFRCAKNRGCPFRGAQHSCLVAARLADKRPPLQATHLPNPESPLATREPQRQAYGYLQNHELPNSDAAIDVHVARSPRLRGFVGRSRAGRPWPLAANSVSRQRHGRSRCLSHRHALVTSGTYQARRGVTNRKAKIVLVTACSCRRRDRVTKKPHSGNAWFPEWSGGADRGRPGQNAPKPPTMQGVPSFGGILAFARTAGGAPIPIFHMFLKPVLQNQVCLFFQQFHTLGAR